jgi:hypothetical protein
LAQAVKNLPSKPKALSSNPSTAKKKENQITFAKNSNEQKEK